MLIPFYRQVSEAQKSQHFEEKLQELITRVIPEIYKLLKTNKVKDSERILLNEIENYITGGGQGDKKKNTKSDWQNSISKVSNISVLQSLPQKEMCLLQLSLNLEKVFLLVSSLETSTIEKSNERSQLDILEKRVGKEKQKTLKAIKKLLSSMQLEHQMMKLEVDQIGNINSQEVYIDPVLKFNKIIEDFIIKPFGKKLNQDLIDIFTKLDFPDKLMKDLKQAIVEGERRKNHRKPQTPSKIQKEEVNPGNSQQSRMMSGKRSVSRGQGASDLCVQTELTIPNILGKRQHHNPATQSQQGIFTQEFSKILASNQSQLSIRASKLLNTSAQIMRQTSQQSQSIQQDDQVSNPIVLLKSQSGYEESQNDIFINKSYHSTQFQTNHNEIITASNDTDKIAHIEAYELVDLQILQTQLEDKRVISGSKTQQYEEMTQKKCYQEIIQRQKSIGSNSSYNQQLQKRRTFINQTQNSYLTKKPKNKGLKHGASFIIAETNESKQKLKGGAASLISQITSKMKYTRVKGSNANSKITTPNKIEEKIQSGIVGNVSKRLNFQEENNNVNNLKEETNKEELSENPEHKESSEYNLLFSNTVSAGSKQQSTNKRSFL